MLPTDVIAPHHERRHPMAANFRLVGADEELAGEHVELPYDDADHEHVWERLNVPDRIGPVHRCTICWDRTD